MVKLNVGSHRIITIELLNLEACLNMKHFFESGESKFLYHYKEYLDSMKFGRFFLIAEWLMAWWYFKFSRRPIWRLSSVMLRRVDHTDNGNTNHLWNVGKCLCFYTAQRPERRLSWRDCFLRWTVPYEVRDGINPKRNFCTGVRYSGESVDRRLSEAKQTTE